MAQDSLLTIMLHEIAAQDFREVSACESAHSIHLEQSVFSGHVTLREKKIMLILSVDVSNAPTVAKYIDGLLQALRLQLPGDYGQRPSGNPGQVGRRGSLGQRREG